MPGYREIKDGESPDENRYVVRYFVVRGPDVRPINGGFVEKSARQSCQEKEDEQPAPVKPTDR